MPVANSHTFSVRPVGDTDIVITRLFNAPPELVFEAMTRPEHIRLWWGNLGEGYSVPVCEMDARVGGKWRFVNKHPKGEVEFYGEIRELNPPDRMVHTEIFAPFPDAESVITTTFTREGDKTRLTATCSYPSAQVRDMVLQSGMEHGAKLSYDRLEEVSQSLTSE